MLDDRTESATPSAAQIEAGNYAKGHVWAHGMRISIENPAGSVRSGTAEDGTEWHSRMQHDYGYVRGTKGADKDHIDVFLGPEYKRRDLPVHVVDQHDPDTGAFDEHKAMMGFPSQQAAMDAYHAAYPDGWAGAGARAVTPMHVDNFKAWATAPGARKEPLAGNSKVARGADSADGGEPQGFTGGGSVAGFLQDPESWKTMGRNLGATVTRNAIGAVGMPTDVINWGLKHAGVGSAEPVGGTDWLRRKAAEYGLATGSGDAEADNWGDAAAGLLSAPQAIHAAAGLAGRGGRALAGHAAGLVQDAMHGSGPLATALAPAAPAFAVKPKGGNWMPDRLDTYLNSTLPREGNTAVGDWKAKQLQTYLKTYLGTAEDPLLKNEAEGRMHMGPDQLLEASQTHGVTSHVQGRDGDVGFPINPNASALEGSPAAFHVATTGRQYRTPWENLADAQGYKLNPREATQDVTDLHDFNGTGQGNIADMLKKLQGEGYPPDELAGLTKQYGWLDKAPPTTDIHTLIDPHSDPLNLGHMIDYLNAATAAHAGMVQHGGLEGLRAQHALYPDVGYGAGVNMAERGLQLSPEQLSRTSVSDAVAKTGQWNDMLNEGKRLADMNKGVKSVLKTYPSGHQWVDLAPEGLQAEGDAMRHCVGGYCNAVEDGSTRILSLRDPQGNPKATVELGPGKVTQAQRDKLTQGLVQEGHTPERAYAQATQIYPDKDLAPSIRQIKGPANRAPGADVQPMVQDLIRGGVHPDLSNWGRVGDLQNTGLIEVHPESDMAGNFRKAGVGPPKYVNQDELTQHSDWLNGPEAGNPDTFPFKPPVPPVPQYATGGGVNAQALAPLGGWGWGYTGVNAAPPVGSPTTAADFALPDARVPASSSSHSAPSVDFNSGTTSAGGAGDAKALSTAASWAGVAGALAHDPTLSKIGGYGGAIAGAADGQYGGVGSLLGRLASNTPGGALAGSLIGQELSATAPSARDVMSTVASATPGVGQLYGLGNFLSGGALGNSLFGSNVAPTESGGYTPAQPGLLGNFGTQSTPAIDASNAAAAANNPNYSNEGHSVAPVGMTGTDSNPGKTADDHTSGSET